LPGAKTEAFLFFGQESADPQKSMSEIVGEKIYILTLFGVDFNSNIGALPGGMECVCFFFSRFRSA